MTAAERLEQPSAADTDQLPPALQSDSQPPADTDPDADPALLLSPGEGAEQEGEDAADAPSATAPAEDLEYQLRVQLAQFRGLVRQAQMARDAALNLFYQSLATPLWQAASAPGL
ncbi:hypothetical protein, partial [Comamonas sp. B-9]|uniref:hypothetical protein n=1 Tax=Comamonas sp. B-9 TaxID=1055192 RepID=UPI0019553F09